MNYEREYPDVSWKYTSILYLGMKSVFHEEYFLFYNNVYPKSINNSSSISRIMRESYRKFAALSLLISPILFFVLSTIAMFLFPGGYEIDDMVFYPSYYKFDKNFFSDLGLLTTVTGRSNLPSSILFCISMTLVGIVFILHAISLPSYFEKTPTQSKFVLFTIIFAVISALGFIGVAFTPFDVFPTAHNACVFIGFGVSTFYCFFFGLAVFKEKSYPNFFGILSMFYILIIVVYTVVVLTGPPFETFPGLTLHVLSQKVVAYLIMVLLPIQASGSLFLIKRAKSN